MPTGFFIIVWSFRSQEKGWLTKMKHVTSLVLLVSLVALVSATTFASPLNWYGESVGDPSAYDITVVHTGTATYDWTVHFNGTTLVGYPQKMMAFAVFDPNATLTDGA